MKSFEIRDLVMCTWQPGCGGVENNCAMPMKHIIKGEIGIVVERRGPHDYKVAFPQFWGYIHPLSPRALEIIK